MVECMTKVDCNLDFFYFPRACSLAPHIILEELGIRYNRHLVDLRTSQNLEEKYLTLNPKGAVPALMIDGKILTETQAILTFLGDLLPENNLLPPTSDAARYICHEWMNFMSSSVHVYIRSIFRPAAYGGDNKTANAAINAQGVKNLAKAISVVEERLGDNTWALGNQFSVADAYLFIMYLWTTDDRITSVPDRPKWDALAERVWQRPTVRRVIGIEQQDREFTVPSHWQLSTG